MSRLLRSSIHSVSRVSALRVGACARAKSKDRKSPPPARLRLISSRVSERWCVVSWIVWEPSRRAGTRGSWLWLSSSRDSWGALFRDPVAPATARQRLSCTAGSGSLGATWSGKRQHVIESHTFWGVWNGFLLSKAHNEDFPAGSVVILMVMATYSGTALFTSLVHLRTSPEFSSPMRQDKSESLTLILKLLGRVFVTHAPACIFDDSRWRRAQDPDGRFEGRSHILASIRPSLDPCNQFKGRTVGLSFLLSRLSPAPT